MMRTHEHKEGTNRHEGPPEGGGTGVEKITTGYWAQYLGDEIICTTNKTSDSCQTDKPSHVINLHIYPDSKIKVQKK